MSLTIITGMSGAGKNTAYKVFEDFGYNCVDNLPVPLLKSFADLAYKAQEDGTLKKVAVIIDIRSGAALRDVQGILEELDADGKAFKILFLDASDEVLLKRFKETRRNHPLNTHNERLASGIDRERRELKFLKDRADYTIDTSKFLVRDFREEIKRLFVDNAEYKSLHVTVMSFGFKYGIPADADIVMDVRFLPNPFYVPELRPLTGNDEKIQNYVLKNKEAHIFLDKMSDLLTFLIPNYIAEGKNSLVIGIGCTGGKHRSVTLTNRLYDRLKDSELYGIRFEHRDLGRE